LVQNVKKNVNTCPDGNNITQGLKTINCFLVKEDRDYNGI